jgi:hypothetical protein
MSLIRINIPAGRNGLVRGAIPFTVLLFMQGESDDV